jgi:hypothetical protein
MADVVRPEFLSLTPVSGKYCEVEYQGTMYRIWRVNPGTPKVFGTKVPYAAALAFLAVEPPMVALVPETKKGKFVSQILAEDQEKINQVKSMAEQGVIQNYNKPAEAPKDGASALADAMAALKAQTEANRALQDTLAKSQSAMEAMASRVAALEASVQSATAVITTPDTAVSEG